LDGRCSENIELSVITRSNEIAKRIHALVASRADWTQLLRDQIREFSPRIFGADITVERYLNIYIEEAQLLLALVRPYLRPGLRLLEVGGGLGFFHVMAHAEGVDVVSTEPAGEGFSGFRAFGLACVTELTGRPERFVDAYAERLPWSNGEFQLVVSSNVLEHVADPEQAIREMWRVTQSGGVLLNHCPNYLVPYEPHYRVPIIPCAVGLSGRAIWRGLQNHALWRSLNSIHSFQIMRIARNLPGATLVFLNPMAMLFERLVRDTRFLSRHRALASFISLPPVRMLLMRMPPYLLTPMVFEIIKTTSDHLANRIRTGNKSDLGYFIQIGKIPWEKYQNLISKKSFKKSHF
jgi:SAM-dependent methyltransferase